MDNLVPLYRSSLHASTSKTDEERNEVFRLRYQVYCLERGFEPTTQFQNNIETDAYDDHAVHFMARHRSTRNVLGVTRLVMDEPETAQLPVETHQLPTVTTILSRLRDTGKVRLAEVSRLAVTRDLNTLCLSTLPQNDDVVRPIHGGSELTRIFPQHVSMGLLALLFRESWELGITHWVALLDSALLRCYRRIGIRCQPIGPAINHRGRRQPILANLTDVWDELQGRCPPLARLIQEFARDTSFETDAMNKRQTQYGRIAALPDPSFTPALARATA